MILILVTTFVLIVNKFKFNLNRNYARIFNHNNPENNDNLHIFTGESYLNESVIEDLSNIIDKFPNNEDDIIEDSFEGYLKREFYNISQINENNVRVIDFITFLTWRKKIGTLFYDHEIKEFYYSITEDKCDLFDFIKLNHIIDENDGAKF